MILNYNSTKDLNSKVVSLTQFINFDWFIFTQQKNKTKQKNYNIHLYRWRWAYNIFIHKKETEKFIFKNFKENICTF